MRKIGDKNTRLTETHCISMDVYKRQQKIVPIRSRQSMWNQLKGGSVYRDLNQGPSNSYYTVHLSAILDWDL